MTLYSGGDGPQIIRGAVQVESLVCHGVVYRLPFAALFRPLAPDKEAELRASVRALGVTNPALVWDSPGWGDNCVIDGANRLRIGAEEGIDVPVHRFAVGDETARRMCEDLNIARRQVSAEEAREARLLRVVHARSEGKSLRAIAAEVGVSESQVRSDLRNANCAVGAQLNLPGKVTGLDGKVRPATRSTAPEDDTDYLSSWSSGDHDEGGDVEGTDPEEPVTPLAPPGTRPAAPDPKPKHFTPGNHSDPDHPFADLLNKLQALAGAITKALAADTDDAKKLKDYLTWVQMGKPPHPQLVRHRAVIIGDKHLGAQFVGFQPLRRLIRSAGLPGRKRSATLVKEYTQGDDES